MFVGARALQVILQPNLHLPQLGTPPHVLHLCHLRVRQEEEGEHDRSAAAAIGTIRARVEGDDTGVSALVWMKEWRLRAARSVKLTAKSDLALLGQHK